MFCIVCVVVLEGIVIYYGCKIRMSMFCISVEYYVLMGKESENFCLSVVIKDVLSYGVGYYVF